jgi:hypothetical protein
MSSCMSYKYGPSVAFYLYSISSRYVYMTVVACYDKEQQNNSCVRVLLLHDIAAEIHAQKPVNTKCTVHVLQSHIAIRS